ncbi:MAG: L-threonylcarbamoyladenylate synthase [Gammaproteobacteria bacterium]|nr:L-threonylcarbamoyladenylate synthase [Gammaproteobacteria bacterium]
MKKQAKPIDQAVKVLRQGGVIAYPTEAVYGLGCDPQNLSAVKNILALKNREKEKGLILVASDLEQFKPYISPLDQSLEEKLVKSWRDSNKAITWLVPVKDSVSEYLKGQFDSLAIRVSKHPLVKELCEKFGGAIVSTSANIATQESARTSEQVKQIFENEIDFIVEGETNLNAQPSEIRDALTDKIIRTAN